MNEFAHFSFPYIFTFTILSKKFRHSRDFYEINLKKCWKKWRKGEKTDRI